MKHRAILFYNTHYSRIRLELQCQSWLPERRKRSCFSSSLLLLSTLVMQSSQAQRDGFIGWGTGRQHPDQTLPISVSMLISRTVLVLGRLGFWSLLMNKLMGDASDQKSVWLHLHYAKTIKADLLTIIGMA